MGCCKDKKQEEQMNTESQSVCPIMGGVVDKKTAEEKGLVREYKGEKYYFCCDGCPEKFDTDPESYINNNTTSECKSGGSCC